MKTTFLIPSINRKTLGKAMDSVLEANGVYAVHVDSDRKGASYSRNLLVREAKTEWVSFLDDDDVILPNYLEALEKEIEDNPDADLIHFRAYFPNGHILPNWPEIEFGNVGICFSVKREVALKHPFKDEPHEDLEFVKRLEKEGSTIVFSKEITYRVRPHQTRMTRG